MNSQRLLLKCFEGAKFIFIGRKFPYSRSISYGPQYVIYMFAKLKDGRNLLINYAEFRTGHFVKVEDPSELAEFKSNMEFLSRSIHVHAGEETTRQTCERYENDIFNRDYLNFDFDVFDCDVKKLYDILDERGL